MAVSSPPQSPPSATAAQAPLGVGGAAAASSPSDVAGPNSSLFLYLAARTLGALAVQMQSVAVGWQVYQITGEVMDLAYSGLAQFAPFFLFVLPAGQVADRRDRRQVILACHVAQLVAAVFLLAYSLLPRVQVWPIFAALAVMGTARAFFMPASQAFLTNIVPPERFGKAVALSSSSFHVAVILGPTLGGLLYAAGPTVVYAIVASLLLVATVMLLWVRSRQRPASREPASYRSLLEGLSFVWSRPIVLGAMSLDLFAVLLGGAVGILPAYARDVLQVDATGLGLLRTAPGVGAVLTSAALAVWPLRRRVGLWMFGGVALFGLSTLGLGWTHNLYVAIFMLALGGAGDMVSVYIRHILVQVATPDAIRGRVSSVNAVFIGASNELGEFESGVTAKLWGLVPSILIGGGLTLCVTSLWARWFRVLSRMDKFPEPVRAPGE